MCLPGDSPCSATSLQEYLYMAKLALPPGRGLGHWERPLCPEHIGISQAKAQMLARVTD